MRSRCNDAMQACRWYLGSRHLVVTDDGVVHSWLRYYSGLGEDAIWHEAAPIMKQYLLAFYWMASTLSASSLVGRTTPKNAVELMFTIGCMLTTLTFYVRFLIPPLPRQVADLTSPRKYTLPASDASA